MNESESDRRSEWARVRERESGKEQQIQTQRFTLNSLVRQHRERGVHALHECTLYTRRSRCVRAGRVRCMRQGVDNNIVFDIHSRALSMDHVYDALACVCVLDGGGGHNMRQTLLRGDGLYRMTQRLRTRCFVTNISLALALPAIVDRWQRQQQQHAQCDGRLRAGTLPMNEHTSHGYEFACCYAFFFIIFPLRSVAASLRTYSRSAFLVCLSVFFFVNSFYFLFFSVRSLRFRCSSFACFVHLLLAHAILYRRR